METCAQDPGRLRDLAAAIKAKELSPTDLVKRYLDRTEVVQPVAAPWRELDAARAMATAAEREAQAARGEILGPLHGIPFGAKDIIDVEGLPSRCNCRALQDIAPAKADAEVVLALKAAGAIVLGKLHTTEFAFFDPSPARNPHNTDHTPGGSSSGSGAGVASGVVPMALGTQTMASVNRPAAYCGIAAFKPSTRSMSGFGVAPLAPSYDTIGFYGWTVDDAVYAYEAAAPFRTRAVPSRSDDDKPRIVIIDDPLIADCGPDMSDTLETEAERFRSMGYNVERQPTPIPFSRLGELHWNTMVYEAARTLAYLKDFPDDQIGQRLREAMDEGAAISTERYIAARSEINALRAKFFAAFGVDEAFFWPATPGPAPKGLESTGEPKYIAPWTVLGGPVVTLPTNGRSGGLPLGNILAGHPGTDRQMGALARRLCPVAAATQLG
jgi:aspartyl-tRNA(Asn)/glutamyl-tRNA(Gln) amidotransferase subunit A